MGKNILNKWYIQGVNSPSMPIPIPAKNRPANIASLFGAAVCKIPPMMKTTPATVTR